jgi:hypothetical protein
MSPPTLNTFFKFTSPALYSLLLYYTSFDNRIQRSSCLIYKIPAKPRQSLSFLIEPKPKIMLLLHPCLLN